MDKSPAETILQKCNEMISLRGKATYKAEFSEQSGYLNSNPDSPEIDFLISHPCDDVKADKLFYEHAANNSANLAKALKVVTEALEDIETNDFAFKKGYSAESFAKSALERAALILKEGTL